MQVWTRAAEGVRLFYGWIVVTIGIVVTCDGVRGDGLAHRVSPAHIEGDGLVADGDLDGRAHPLLSMGLGAFLWRLSDRFGTRVVVLGAVRSSASAW